MPMNRSQIGFLNTFIDDVRRTEKEAESIHLKKAEHKMRQDEFSLKKRMYEDKIKMQEQQGQITALEAEAAKKEFNDYMKMISDSSKVEQNMISHAQAQNQLKQRNLANTGLQILPYMKAVTTPGSGTRYERGFTTKTRNPKDDTFKREELEYKRKELDFKRKQLKNKGKTPNKQQLQIEQVLGDVENGGYFEGDEFIEFPDRLTAERYANANLGSNYEKRHPEAKAMLDKKYGPELSDFPTQRIRKQANPLRAAYDYLVNEVGMTPEAAKQWLEENN